MEDNESSIRNRLLNFIERDRFSFTTAIVYIFILGAVRSIMEAYIGAYQRYSIYLFSQHVLLSYPEILIGVLLVYVVTRIEIKKYGMYSFLDFGCFCFPR